MENEKYLDDISHIKDMMSRSSQFISLSGKGGIIAGGSALIAAYSAWEMLYNQNEIISGELVQILPQNIYIRLFLIGAITLAFSIFGGIVTSRNRAKKQGLPFWDATASRLITSLAIPLAAGGIFLLILLYHGLVGLVAPGTLVFYGLALINASKYSSSDIHTLGILEVITGLVATFFIGYGLFFWAFGFGVLHIAYGIWMWNKYERVK